MRVLILSVSDKRHMPMAAVYSDYLKSKNIPFDIIRTNRYEQRQEPVCRQEESGSVYEFNMIFPTGAAAKDKLSKFLTFRSYALKIMRRNKYDFIIVWNENTAALFAEYLWLHYRNRCCINVRDVYKQLKGIRTLVDLAVRASSFATVPTPECDIGFPDKTLCVFNRDTSLLRSYKMRSSFREEGRPIRITHMGVYAKAQKASVALADLLGNDPRYELHFYGAGFDTGFKRYCEKKGYKNIVTGGAFPAEETAKYLENTDIINSYYNRFTHPSLRISFGIKHSYTPMLHLPGLADEDTCWGRISKNYGIAYLINDQNLQSLPDDLYAWYRSLDYEAFCRNCEALNHEILRSVQALYLRLDALLEEKKP